MSWQHLYQLLDMPLRYGNAGLWALIVLIALPGFYRIVFQQFDANDALWSLGGLIGIGLTIFQFRALAGMYVPHPDGLTTTALSTLLISAALILLWHVTKAPPGHQRAALIGHAAFLAACALLGVLLSVVP